MKRKELYETVADAMLTKFSEVLGETRETLESKLYSPSYPVAILLTGRAGTGKGTTAELLEGEEYNYKTISAGGLKRAFAQSHGLSGLQELKQHGEFSRAFKNFVNDYDWTGKRTSCPDALIAQFNQLLGQDPAAAEAVDVMLDYGLALALTENYHMPIVAEGRTLGGIHAIHRSLAVLAPPFYSVLLKCNPKEQEARLSQRLKEKKEYSPEALEAQIARDIEDWSRLKERYGINFLNQNLYHVIDTSEMTPEAVAKEIVEKRKDYCLRHNFSSLSGQMWYGGLFWLKNTRGPLKH